MSDYSNLNQILIFGFAREGISSLRFLRSHGFVGKVTVSDDKPFENLTDEAKAAFQSDTDINFLEGSALKDIPIGQYDQIFLTPGTPVSRVPNRLWPILTSQTSIFLEKFYSQTVGVTGTKGKSTTSSLIFDILKTADKNAVLLGNIGKPPLDFFDKIQNDTIVVFELSSHQLSLVKNSPHVAVFLNIFPEHLDYYKDFDEYFNAKAQITKFQTKDDFLVINTTNHNAKLEKLAQTTQAQVHPIVSKSIETVSSWQTELPGSFNRANIAAAREVAKLFKVDEKTARLAIQNFKPLEHRLERVGTFHEIIFYNDSIATVPEATVQALNTLGTQVETMLLGGFDRHLSYENLAKSLAESQVKNLVLFPTTGEQIKASLLNPSQFTIFETDNMEQAVKFAYKHTSPGKVVLLSPASPSFNLFKDYVDRGNKFKEWVVKLGKSG